MIMFIAVGKNSVVVKTWTDEVNLKVVKNSVVDKTWTDEVNLKVVKK